MLLSENSCKHKQKLASLQPSPKAWSPLASAVHGFRANFVICLKGKGRGFPNYWKLSAAGAVGGFGSVLHGTENLCYA